MGRGPFIGAKRPGIDRFVREFRAGLVYAVGVLDWDHEADVHEPGLGETETIDTLKARPYSPENDGGSPEITVSPPLA